MAVIEKDSSTPRFKFWALNTSDNSLKTDLVIADITSSAIVRDGLTDVSTGTLADKANNDDSFTAGNVFNNGDGSYYFEGSSATAATLCKDVKFKGAWTDGSDSGILIGETTRIQTPNPDDSAFGANTTTPLDATGIRSALGLDSNDLDTQISGLNTKLDTIDGIVDSILIDTGTTLPGLINGIDQSASRRSSLSTSTTMQIPDSGTEEYVIELRCYSEDGVLTNATTDPTLTVTGSTSGNLTSNLADSGAPTNPSTGVYKFCYQVSSSHAEEQIELQATAVMSDSTVYSSSFSFVSDYTADSFTASDRTILNSILTDTGTTIPATLVTIGSDADTAATEATANGVTLTNAFPTNFSSLLINGSGHISRVTLVDTTTSNSDMRGTDGANTNTPLTSAGIRSAVGLSSANLDTQLSTIDTVVDAILALFSGITSVASWLGALAGKTADTSTRTEINATTAGANYNETSDSLEAQADGESTAISESDIEAIASRILSISSNIPNTDTTDTEYIIGDDISQEFEVALPSGYDDIIFIIKEDLTDADSEAIIKISEASGLEILNGEAYSGTSSNASITWASDKVTIEIDSSISVQLPEGCKEEGIKRLKEGSDIHYRRANCNLVQGTVKEVS